MGYFPHWGVQICPLPEVAIVNGIANTEKLPQSQFV
jgi:hypothetical protein